MSWEVINDKPDNVQGSWYNVLSGNKYSLHEEELEMAIFVALNMTLCSQSMLKAIQSFSLYCLKIVSPSNLKTCKDSKW